MMFATVAVALAGMLAGPASEPPVPSPDPRFVVSASWLSQHLHDKNLVILSVGAQADPDRTHIPGARPFQGNTIDNPARRQDGNATPIEADLRAALEKLGISDNSQVVLVLMGGSRNSIPNATRPLHIMLYGGLEHVAILDGGMTAWRAARLPTTTADTPDRVPGHITSHVIPGLFVDASYVQAHRASPHTRIVDARSSDFYSGPALSADANMGTAMSAGHIPGAVSIPFNSVIDDSSRVLPVAILEKMFRAAGVAPGDTVIGYCHVGFQATTMLLAARITGHPVKLYNASFSDWSEKKLPTEGGKP